jgi:anti-sigma regulatory factor (Ser/Thr protein kinase)
MEGRRNSELPSEMTQQAVIESIPTLVEFVRNHAREAGFDEEEIRDLGLAGEEAFRNIIRYACADGCGEIKISSTVHDSGSLILTIVDTGKAFNMLLASTFPEAEDFAEPGQIPSTRAMKRAVKNIEYKRDVNRNILVFTMPRL